MYVDSGKITRYALIRITNSYFTVMAQRAEPHLKTFWGHAKVELAPPRPSEWPVIRSSFVNLSRSIAEGGYRNLTVREFTRNALVGVEVMCWFFIGEMIGRRSIIGYKV